MTEPALQDSARLGPGFFAAPTRVVAERLLGCTLIHRGVGGVIVETEAYEESEPACHGFGGRTERNGAIFGPPGRAYVYICYGIHRMFNVVTEADGVGGAVLIRALRPTHGIEQMRLRRRCSADRDLCSGPGKLCEALAIEHSQTHESLTSGSIALFAREPADRAPRVLRGPRIGITKAAELPWRYCVADSRFLSRPAVAA